MKVKRKMTKQEATVKCSLCGKEIKPDNEIMELVEYNGQKRVFHYKCANYLLEKGR